MDAAGRVPASRAVASRSAGNLHGVARRVAVPDRVLAMGLLDAVDYLDSYVRDRHPAGTAAGPSADALTALAFERLPRWLRALVRTAHRHVLRLRLELPSTVPVPGWRRLLDEPEEAVYGVDGPLLSARLVVSATPATVQVSTLVRYARPAARPVWAAVGPVHRAVARTALDRGVAEAARRDAGS